MSSILKVDTIQDQAGNNIINENANVITIGASGDTITSVGTFTSFTSTGIDDNATSTAITIDSSQNVGVGTSSPTRALTVSGSVSPVIAIVDTGTSGTPSLFFGDSSADNVGKIQYANSTNSLSFVVNSSERMNIANSGRVGINVTSPSGLLHVQSASSGASVNGSGDEIIAENSATAGISILSGNSNQGQLIFGDDGDNNVGRLQYDHSNNSMQFIVNASERMRIANNGYIGIGTPTTTYALNISNSAGEMRIKTTDGQNVANACTSILEYHGTDNRAGYVGFVGGDMVIHTDTYSAGDIKLQTNGSERMRINSNGNIQIATTTESGRLHIASSTTAGTDPLVVFSDASGTDCGSIDLNASGNTVAYTTSSDYRLKENVDYNFDATARLKQLKPARFNFIADANTTVDGFIAHEVSSVVPEAISGEKDAMKTEEYEVTPAVLDEDGNVITEAVMGTREVPDYQGIDQSKLVPLLVKTIQELEARITALETNNP